MELVVDAAAAAVVVEDKLGVLVAGVEIDGAALVDNGLRVLRVAGVEERILAVDVGMVGVAGLRASPKEKGEAAAGATGAAVWAKGAAEPPNENPAEGAEGKGVIDEAVGFIAPNIPPPTV